MQKNAWRDLVIFFLRPDLFVLRMIRDVIRNLEKTKRGALISRMPQEMGPPAIMILPRRLLVWLLTFNEAWRLFADWTDGNSDTVHRVLIVWSRGWQAERKDTAGRCPHGGDCRVLGSRRPEAAPCTLACFGAR